MLVGVIAEESLMPSAIVDSLFVREAANAADVVNAGFVISILVDNPALASDLIDAFVGHVITELASAADVINAGIVAAAAIAEVITAIDSPNVPTIYVAAIDESSSASMAITLATQVTTWNSSDKSINIVLSGGNLIVTSTAANSTDQAVRSINPQSSGKWYFETTWSNGGSGADTGVGIATASAVLTSVGNNVSLAVMTFCVTGNIYNNASNTAISLGPFSAGSVICMAVDMDNKRMWFRKDAGNWNNSGTANPATNTGGFNISTLFTSGVPAYAIYSVNATAANAGTVTANFGASAFAQSIPSGFTAWNG
jgi:hypothetical protein